MPKGLRSALKNARREIIARVESGTAPDWVADNCCVIDKYCRAAFKAPLSKHRSLRPLISELFDERDNYFTASELCEFAESRGIAFSHAEICVLPELIAAEAVLRISDILGSGAGGMDGTESCRIAHVVRCGGPIAGEQTQSGEHLSHGTAAVMHCRTAMCWK